MLVLVLARRELLVTRWYQDCTKPVLVQEISGELARDGQAAALHVCMQCYGARSASKHQLNWQVAVRLCCARGASKHPPTLATTFLHWWLQGWRMTSCQCCELHKHSWSITATSILASCQVILAAVHHFPLVMSLHTALPSNFSI